MRERAHKSMPKSTEHTEYVDEEYNIEEKPLWHASYLQRKSVDLQAYHCETIGEANLKNVQKVKDEKWKSMRSSLG